MTWVTRLNSTPPLTFAAGICIDGSGHIYVSDIGDNTIKQILIDSDFDDVPDVEEGGTTSLVVGVNDRNLDSDNDGMSNAAEFLAGTDPMNPNSYLAINSILIGGDGRAEIRWFGVAGKYYVVKYSEGLPGWTQLGSIIQGQGITLSVIDPEDVKTRQGRMYRVFLAD
jgi:hypothetical protein